MKKLIYFPCVLLLLLIAGCTNSSDNGNGGGTETGDPGNVSEINEGFISGKVVAGVNRNISLIAAKVWLDTDRTKYVKTNQDGSYILEHIKEGEHDVWGEWKNSSGDIFSGKINSIQIGKSKKGIYFYVGESLILDLSGSLVGQIELFDNDDFNNYSISLDGAPYETNVLEDGSFYLEGIANGDYDVQVLRNNKILKTIQVKIESGEEFNLVVPIE